VSAVLTTADKITCKGAGVVQTPGDPALVIGNNPVLTVAKVQGATIFNCVPPEKPQPAPCATVASLAKGISTKLFVSGSPVLLDGTTGMGTTHVLGPAAASRNMLDAS
jgi:hypothetical protein